MRKTILHAALLLMSVAAMAQPGLDYYLPDEDYGAAIPDPETYFGHSIGKQHLTHDQLTAYLSLLASQSDRIILQEYARSWENRPLFHLIITSPANHGRLEQIRKEHGKLSDPDVSPTTDLSGMPGKRRGTAGIPLVLRPVCECNGV